MAGDASLLTVRTRAKEQEVRDLLNADNFEDSEENFGTALGLEAEFERF